jgi:hypothetical protein
MADELDVMRSIADSLGGLEDEQARSRVLMWAIAKFGNGTVATQANARTPNNMSAPQRAPAPTGADGEIPGIAKLSPSGDLLWTVRDVKARTANDAAIRLAHVAIWAANQLTGVQNISSKNVLVPLLRRWRVYDGNTRKALAAQRGIVRDGDSISLDFHAGQEAERYVNEILDPSVEGKWRPGAVRRRTQSGRAEGDAIDE